MAERETTGDRSGFDSLSGLLVWLARFFVGSALLIVLAIRFARELRWTLTGRDAARGGSAAGILILSCLGRLRSPAIGPVRAGAGPFILGIFRRATASVVWALVRSVASRRWLR